MSRVHIVRLAKFGATASATIEAYRPVAVQLFDRSPVAGFGGRSVHPRFLCERTTWAEFPVLSVPGVATTTLPTMATTKRRKNVIDDHSTLREHFAWVYGTLAMVHAAVEGGATSYKPLHRIIRARFRNGHLAGAMQMRPLHDDEKTKIERAGRAATAAGR